MDDRAGVALGHYRRAHSLWPRPCIRTRKAKGKGHVSAFVISAMPSARASGVFVATLRAKVLQLVEQITFETPASQNKASAILGAGKST